MFRSLALVTALAFGMSSPVPAQEKPGSKPVELEFLRASVGVWDAEIEVWPQGPGADSIKFQGVETNRAHGEHWIASSFDSEYQGEITSVHSIVGYDLDEKMLVGQVIDQGPYAAKMTGRYDQQSKTVHWTLKVKDPAGKPIGQQILISQKAADERVLVLSVPDEGQDGFVKVMQIRFVRRK